MKEQRVRQLRDNIYGPQSDMNWRNCREHWMRDSEVAWLMAHQPQTEARANHKATEGRRNR